MRIQDPRMEYYHQTYQNSILWKGKESLKNKKIIIYCEQGTGDTVQFLRYLPLLKTKGCHIILHCPEILHCVLPYISGVDEWLEKFDDNLPEHDFHILILDLPFLTLKDKPVDIETWWEGKELEKYMSQVLQNIPTTPYINFKEQETLPDGTNIGICWAGSPAHYNDAERSCNLKYFNCLNGRLFSLQKEIYEKYTAGAEKTVLWGTELNNLLDTLKLINSLDVVVTVDTLIMHLAGALNKKTYVMLGKNPDARWKRGEGTKWYPSITFCRSDGDWELAFKQLPEELRK